MTMATDMAGSRKRGCPDACDEDSSEYNCSICHELLVEPVTGICGHQFCKYCLEKWRLTNTSSSSGVPCPECRGVICSRNIKQFGVCRLLERLLSRLFPDEYIHRLSEVQAARDKDARAAREQVDVQVAAVREMMVESIAGLHALVGRHMETQGNTAHQPLRAPTAANAPSPPSNPAPSASPAPPASNVALPTSPPAPSLGQAASHSPATATRRPSSPPQTQDHLPRLPLASQAPTLLTTQPAPSSLHLSSPGLRVLEGHQRQGSERGPPPSWAQAPHGRLVPFHSEPTAGATIGTNGLRVPTPHASMPELLASHPYPGAMMLRTANPAARSRSPSPASPLPSVPTIRTRRTPTSFPSGVEHSLLRVAPASQSWSQGMASQGGNHRPLQQPGSPPASIFSAMSSLFSPGGSYVVTGGSTLVSSPTAHSLFMPGGPTFRPVTTAHRRPSQRPRLNPSFAMRASVTPSQGQPAATLGHEPSNPPSRMQPSARASPMQRDGMSSHGMADAEASTGQLQADPSTCSSHDLRSLPAIEQGAWMAGACSPGERCPSSTSLAAEPCTHGSPSNTRHPLFDGYTRGEGEASGHTPLSLGAGSDVEGSGSDMGGDDEPDPEAAALLADENELDVEGREEEEEELAAMERLPAEDAAMSQEFPSPPRHLLTAAEGSCRRPDSAGPGARTPAHQQAVVLPVLSPVLPASAVRPPYQGQAPAVPAVLQAAAGRAPVTDHGQQCTWQFQQSSAPAQPTPVLHRQQQRPSQRYCSSPHPMVDLSQGLGLHHHAQLMPAAWPMDTHAPMMDRHNEGLTVQPIQTHDAQVPAAYPRTNGASNLVQLNQWAGYSTSLQLRAPTVVTHGTHRNVPVQNSLAPQLQPWPHHPHQPSLCWPIADQARFPGLQPHEDLMVESLERRLAAARAESVMYGAKERRGPAPARMLHDLQRGGERTAVTFKMTEAPVQGTGAEAGPSGHAAVSQRYGCSSRRSSASGGSSALGADHSAQGSEDTMPHAAGHTCPPVPARMVMFFGPQAGVQEHMGETDGYCMVDQAEGPSGLGHGGASEAGRDEGDETPTTGHSTRGDHAFRGFSPAVLGSATPITQGPANGLLTSPDKVEDEVQGERVAMGNGSPMGREQDAGSEQHLIPMLPAPRSLTPCGSMGASQPRSHACTGQPAGSRSAPTSVSGDVNRAGPVVGPAAGALPAAHTTRSGPAPELVIQPGPGQLWMVEGIPVTAWPQAPAHGDPPVLHVTARPMHGPAHMPRAGAGASPPHSVMAIDAARPVASAPAAATWHDLQGDLPMRQAVVQHIVETVLAKLPGGLPTARTVSFQQCVAKIEQMLYTDAPSAEAYADRETLMTRFMRLRKQLLDLQGRPATTS